ncbi:MAG: preprotein translocase subunit SecA [Planctomycetes bacterium]|nr:preprotein translocase subunit SecA [Planctomycetota bacterium]
MTAGLPSATWRMLSARRSGPPVPRGLDAAWHRAVGWINSFVPRTARFLKLAQAVLDLHGDFENLGEPALAEQAGRIREMFMRGRQTDADVLRAFALVREVAFRVRGEKPFKVQVAGALAIFDGCIAEMSTGEGKTLTTTMPAVVLGWQGRGCHVLTVNDYLAKRDAELMGGIYRFCGLTVASIQQEAKADERRRAYGADITYCTNKEVVADFLRDRLTLGRTGSLPAAMLERLTGGRTSLEKLVQRGLYAAIIDEADSIMIDEAVTPLIISGQPEGSPQQTDVFQQAAKLAETLKLDRDYTVDRTYREILLTEAGKARLAELTKDMGGLWRGERRSQEMVTQALTARCLYLRDKQYVIQEEKVVIVDEFTGRLMPDREWRDGLHQAVSAREGLEVVPPKDTHARLSFQRFFRLYRRLAGMTGTASEARGEFWRIYKLPVAVIPTNRPCIRRQMPDRIFSAERAKMEAVVDEIAAMNRTGRPVLVGTRSVGISETLGAMLAKKGLAHSVLNAVRHADEAGIVAQAGQPGKITVATNMAGRGTDIKLGPGVRELGGLHVIATERHESRRIDRQLFGRTGRQGDPGSAQAFVSLEDELVVQHGRHLAAMAGAVYRADEKGELAGRMLPRLFEKAQRHSNSQATRQRLDVLRTDDWLDEYLGFAGAEG